MPANNRPSTSSFLSTSSKALETKNKLDDAQLKINELEKELQDSQSSLISHIGEQSITHSVVPIRHIERRPYRSRKEIDPQIFDSLIHSIETYGFRGSIWVQKLPDGNLRLIAGETRLDAAIEAGLNDIPVDIAEVDDITAVKLSRVENSRRKNINALDDTEELLYLLSLILNKDKPTAIKILYKYKNALEGTSKIDDDTKRIIESVFTEVAPEISLKTFISSRLPLLELPKEVLDAYEIGQIEYTKAILIGRIANKSLRKKILKEVIDKGLSLSAIKSMIKPTSKGGVIEKVRNLESKIESVNSKTISKLSKADRNKLKTTLHGLKDILLRKLEEIEDYDT